MGHAGGVWHIPDDGGIRMNRTEWFEQRGFVVVDGRAKCEQCEALSINGVACHEKGCPNIVRCIDED